MTIIEAKFIKKYWFNIVKTSDGFAVINTYRSQNMEKRNNIEKAVYFCKTIEEAKDYFKKLEL